VKYPRGGRVTGLDFLAPAIEAARGIAASIGVDAEFVTADVYDAATVPGGRSFDIVYTGRAVLAAGGPGDKARYLTEGHPVSLMLDYGTGYPSPGLRR
jgi:hypothetical protein